jgi:hypothetical protein
MSRARVACRGLAGSLFVICALTVTGGAATTCDCPYQLDYDQDLFLTSLDLNLQIDYLFAGGPRVQDPLCPIERADFDCDGFPTALDLGHMIDHLFAGGPGPCDPCGPDDTALVISYGSCKTFTKSVVDIPADQSCIEYEYDSVSILTIQHLNAGFNCCPDSFSAYYQGASGFLFVREDEWLSNPCYCLCLFDFSYQITGLAPGTYRIVLDEPYVDAGMERLEFTVHLETAPSGTVCVHRDQYPWGNW